MGSSMSRKGPMPSQAKNTPGPKTERYSKGSKTTAENHTDGMYGAGHYGKGSHKKSHKSKGGMSKGYGGGY